MTHVHGSDALYLTVYNYIHVNIYISVCYTYINMYTIVFKFIWNFKLKEIMSDWKIKYKISTSTINQNIIKCINYITIITNSSIFKSNKNYLRKI